MNKLTLIALLTFCSSVVYCQHDFFIFKKRNKAIAIFGKGSYIAFQGKDRQWFTGSITKVLWWNRKEKLGKFNSSALHEWLRLLICYYAAYLIFQYGLAKIYNNQFRHIYYRDDSLNGTLTGFAVDWSFFSYSCYFTLLIGILQLAGGVMLLFLKTRLAGAALLLPVMINILLINLFYGVSTDAFVNAILISVALSYILWLKRRKLVQLFFNKRPGIFFKKNILCKSGLKDHCYYIRVYSGISLHTGSR
ncbi:MAG: hypothetical protein ABI863_03630 [Ginsengibacter sp.]